MRDYGKVAPTFWLRGSGKLLRGHPLAQVLALYLFTAPGASMTGLFYLALPSVRHETGLDEEELAEALDKIEEIGIAFYDDAAELVWVPEMARYQIGDELKVGDKRVKGVEREIAVHEGHPFHAQFVAKYKDAFSLTVDAPDPEPWPVRHRKPLPRPMQAPSSPLGSQELTVLAPALASGLSGSGSGSPPDPFEPLPEEDPETAGARRATVVPLPPVLATQGPARPIATAPHGQASLALAMAAERPAPPPAPAARPSRRRGPTEPAEPTQPAERLYAKAFAEGQIDAGAERFTPPTDSGAQHAFRTSLKIHAVDADGKPLRGEELHAWVRKTSAEYRRCKPADGAFGGFTPRKMFSWLDAGGARASPVPTYRQPSPAVQPPAGPGESSWTLPTEV